MVHVNRDDMKAAEEGRGAHRHAVKKGAKVVTGGKRSALGGTFFDPTVLTDQMTDMVITKEETFGPVAPLYRCKTDDEAIKMASNTPTLTLPRSPGREGRGHRPHLACRRGARIRHCRHQRRHHLDEIPPARSRRLA